MTTPAGNSQPRNRAARVVGRVLAVVCGLFVLLGYAAFAWSFNSTPFEKKDDIFAITFLFAAIGAFLAVISLLISAVPLAQRWWRPLWALPAAALLALCLARITIASYTY